MIWFCLFSLSIKRSQKIKVKTIVPLTSRPLYAANLTWEETERKAAISEAIREFDMTIEEPIPSVDQNHQLIWFKC